MSKAVSHITHVEELFLTKGIEGLYESLNQLWVMKGVIEGTDTNGYSLSTKYDGAPAIVCGVHPITGKFFVGTKAVFNNQPKVCYTLADIMKHYPDNDSLLNVLHRCLHYLQPLGIKTVLQGDLMYINDSPQTSTLEGPQDENGKLQIAFTPNTITYGVPYFTDLANKIMNSKMGIIFHTEYDKDWNVSSNPKTASLNHIDEVWFRDASFTMNNPKNMQTLGHYLNDIEDAIDELDKSVINKFYVNKRINTLTSLFFNYIIREKKFYDQAELMLVDYIAFVNARTDDEVAKAVKDETKQRKTEEKKELQHFFQKNTDTLIDLFNVTLLMVAEKHDILQILNDDQVGLQPFVKTDEGLEKTNHEGFVLSDADGNLTKWVNRREFSERNFANNRWEE